MIYLIDDKTNRQQDFGWDENKLLSYKDDVVSISCYNEMESIEIRELIFSDGNIILFHESFFENIDYKHKKDGNQIKNDLSKFPIEKKNSKLIFFSGSYNSREANETGGSMPVSILYQNLDCFLKNFKKNDLVDLNYLFFGENPEIEPELINKNEKSNSLLIYELTNGNINCIDNNIIITGNRQGFPIPFNNVTNQTIFNKNINDQDISLKITHWFSENEYDKIFIPLCFGPTLSDYNGLRLATHIRCTNSKNQLKPIFIYGFVDYSYLIENEYFDILKIKNVFLISCSKQSFHDALSVNISDLTVDFLPKEIKKLNLQIPNNYEDSHSIANEWAIYRWSQIIGASDINIEKINEIQNSNLYFKYLKTIYPISKSDTIEINKLKINFKGNSKILYIDDEADKGWREIFETIFYDKNQNIDFSYLDNEFNEKTKEEVINISLKTIKDEDIDLVILDFRLHKDDFDNNEIETITGYQILKKIKEYNKGIQVIIFSATNKIWNLQALQEAGADGFIVKESPENSIDSKFTKKSIENFIYTITKSLNNIFLKDFYSKLQVLKNELLPRKIYKKTNKPLPKEFVDETLKWYELSLNFLYQGINEEQLISTFLIYFTIIENLSNRVIEIENPIKEGDYFKYQFRKNLQRLNDFIEDIDNRGFYRKINSKYKSPKRTLRWDIKIYNTIDFISDNKLSIESVNYLIKKRNDIIHSNSTLGSVIEIKKDDILLLNRIIYEGLMNVI